jgi:undecaprenyl-diphosphatase
MITYFQAIVIGLLQGISELFPISSLGHSVIFPKLFGWNLNQGQPYFLTFLVAVHLATATVLFLFFWKDWLEIIKGLGRSLAQRQIRQDDAPARLGWLLVMGTIPAGILGLLFQEKIQLLFASPKIAAFFLIVNAGLLYGAERLRQKAPVDKNPVNTNQRLAKLTWMQSFKVGLSQILALIPGLSRSGSTMAGSLLVGLSNEDAARFSFLLATPIIGAAAVLKLPELFYPQNHAVVGPAIAGALAAALAAYFSIKFLMKFFHTNKLTPFAVYCALAGVISLLILYFR